MAPAGVPLPQERVTDVRFVPYATDSYQQATARAMEDVGRRYGETAVTYMEVVQSIAQQYLNAGAQGP